MTSSGRATPALFHASQSGRPAFDDDAGGGNPFASALVELLGRPTLTLSALRSEIVALTRRKSAGLQDPDISRAVDAPEWRLRPVPPGATRVALVVVFADYRRAGTSSLPGALRDLDRIRTALADAGFRVTASADPTTPALVAALRDFADASRDAEAAALYVTGHGFEHDGEVYVLPGDAPFDGRSARLPDRGIRIAGLTAYARATAANLVFFGGCRTHW
jgi:hypothetical protein